MNRWIALEQEDQFNIYPYFTCIGTDGKFDFPYTYIVSSQNKVLMMVGLFIYYTPQ